MGMGHSGQHSANSLPCAVAAGLSFGTSCWLEFRDQLHAIVAELHTAVMLAGEEMAHDHGEGGGRVWGGMEEKEGELRAHRAEAIQRGGRRRALGGRAGAGRKGKGEDAERKTAQGRERGRGRGERFRLWFRAWGSGLRFRVFRIF